MKRTLQMSCVWFALSLSFAIEAHAQVGDISGVTYPNWIPSDGVAPTVTTLVTYDGAAQLWRYEYQLANGASAAQPIISLDLAFNAAAIPEPLASTVATRTLVVLGQDLVPYRRRSREEGMATPDESRPALRLNEAAEARRGVRRA